MKKIIGFGVLIFILILFSIFHPGFKEHLFWLLVAYIGILMSFLGICKMGEFDFSALWKEDSKAVSRLLFALFLVTFFYTYRYSIFGAFVLNEAGGYGLFEREFYGNIGFAFTRLTNFMDWCTYIVGRMIRQDIPPDLVETVNVFLDDVRHGYSALEKIKSLAELLQAVLKW